MNEVNISIKLGNSPTKNISKEEKNQNKEYLMGNFLLLIKVNRIPIKNKEKMIKNIFKCVLMFIFLSSLVKLIR